MSTDLELLQRWREGDRRAGEELLGRHFDSLVGFFHYKLDDGVEDLIQATMLACVEGRDRIAHGSFRAYLFGVARRMLYQHYRRLRARDHVDFGSCSVRDLGPSPSTAFRRAESRELMIEALRQVPIDFQIALELHYFEGLASPEIAAVLEIETATVRTRLHRGRKLLRAAFDQLSADPERASAMMARLEASRDGTAPRP
ncbi:MAG: sigma-70 family RNA polymerase sigma factor [Myxococcales bacterium]|nr:sigma-70 family RNA polymerase sigma factor [Myxococcales bacterium]MCB9714483.1 sigma-70 family RNA polymerase sigma factor [Myxococcales bacterium]